MKLTKVVLCLTVAALLLAGCSGAGNSATSNSATGNSVVSSTEEAASAVSSIEEAASAVSSIEEAASAVSGTEEAASAVGSTETGSIDADNTETGSTTAVISQEAFTYVHDPRENPEAMKDIIEDENAVYGFSPDPESTRLGEYAEYDWGDPEFAAQAKAEREAYHESMSSMMDILYDMRDKGASLEEMARAVSTERNRLRLAAYEGDPEGLEKVKKSNLETYGHEEGPTPDELFEKYGSWEEVLQKAFGTNMGMDACCGLYDEYYPLYQELGYVE